MPSSPPRAPDPEPLFDPDDPSRQRAAHVGAQVRGPASATRAPAEEGRGAAGAHPERDTEVDGKPAGAGKKEKGRLAFLKELPVLLLVAFLLALLIKTFLIQAFYIPSESMEPTLDVGDRVLVNKVVYHLHPPRRGDILVFEDPHAESDRTWLSAFLHWLTEGLGVSTNPEKDFIKRVVALPGETVEVHRGVVMIDGEPLREPYLNPIEDFSDFPPTRVPEGMLFVMGDNRTNSSDSRGPLGFIPYDRVVGRAFVIIWPPGRLQWLRA